MFGSHTMFHWWSLQRLYDGGGGAGAGAGAGSGAGAGTGAGGNGDDAVKVAFLARDEAVARANKLAKEVEDIRKLLPTDEQKARLADLEKKELEAEEERKRKSGEFDGWRKQITDQHEQEKAALLKHNETEKAKAAAIDHELNDTLIGLAFAGASDLFGPTAKTVLLPKVAQSYFGKHVVVEKDETTGERRIIVRDAKGNTVIDPKTGRAAEFASAMEALIAAHPDREHLLRGSGKVGSGSAGGANGTGTDGVDLSRLSAGDFQNPAVQKAIKDQMAKAGGLVIAPSLQRLNKQ